MKEKTAGEEIMKNPKNIQAVCKICGFMFFGAEQVINHLEVHA